MSNMNTEDTGIEGLTDDAPAGAIEGGDIEAGSEVQATESDNEGDLFDSVFSDESMEASAKRTLGEEEEEDAEQETVKTEDALGELPYKVNEDGSITVQMKVDGEVFERTLSPESLVADLQKATAANKRFQEAKTLKEQVEEANAQLGNARAFYDAWQADPVLGLQKLMELEPDRFQEAVRRVQNEQRETEVPYSEAEEGSEKQVATGQADPFKALKESFEDNPEARQLVELLEAENARNKQLMERIDKMESQTEEAELRSWATKAQRELDVIADSWATEAPELGLPSWDQDAFLDYMQTQADPTDWESGVKTFKRINIDPDALKNAVVRKMMEKQKKEADLEVPRPAGKIRQPTHVERYSKDPLFDQLLR